MLVGNILLALAWAALQGDFSLTNLIAGYVLGYFILVALVKGGVLAPSATSAKSISRLAWQVSFSGNWYSQTCGWRWTWRHRVFR